MVSRFRQSTGVRLDVEAVREDGVMSSLLQGTCVTGAVTR
jgi:hypothetical protein